MGIGIKHCSLMMSLTKPFEIQNGADFSLSHLKDMNYQKKGVMVKPCILVVVGVERFAPCKDDLCPFSNHYVIIETIFQFLISILFLVQVVWRKFEHGSNNIATSFRWRPKYTLNLSLFQLCFPCFSFHVHFVICFYFVFCLMFVILGKFWLFIYVYNGFQSFFANRAKTFVVLISRKSCHWLGSLLNRWRM